MILYWLLINLVSVSLRTYFRRIYVVNAENIPKNKPVLLAPNHPNSFMDGTVLAVVVRSKLNQLVRGDVFNHPLANWALRSMRLLPIYRSRDTKEDQNQTELNNQTYEACYELFRKKGMILIFPEGLCVTERRLRPMKKGMSRMVLEMLNKYPEADLHIVPVGLNYSNPGKFRSEICINFGHAIPASEYMNMTDEKLAPKAMNELNMRVADSLEREMVIIRNPEDDEVAGKYLEMARNHYKPSFWGFIKNRKKRFLAEKRAANDLNDLSVNHPDTFYSFSEKVDDYFQKLKMLGISDKQFAIPFFEKVLYLLFAVVFAIPGLVGIALNFLPITLAESITRKKVKNLEFFDSVNFGIGMVLGVIYFWLLVIILMPIFGWYGFLIALGIRVLGFLYYYWSEAATNTLHWFKLMFTSKGRNLNKALKSQREFILHYFG